MTRCWRRCGFQLVIASAVLVGGAIAIFGDCAFAQIAPDGTLPNNSIVTPSGNTSLIEGGTRASSNLFHSFDQFSIPTGGAAHFNNALDVQNIFSRVTGKSISNIDGLIRANGAANLFLLNPNGIIFGPNAELNIGGSFVGSTASSLNFADGTQFSATASQTTPLLTVSVPIGLQYGGTAGSILDQSQAKDISGELVELQVQSGKTLALVGGDVSLDGGILQAPGGRVELGGVASSGTVGLNVEGNNLNLSFPDDVERADLSLTNGAEVNVRAGGGGSIALNARNLYVLAGSRLQAGIASDLGSVDTQGGDITLNAKEAITIANNSVIANRVLPRAVGNGGGINITTGSLAVIDGAQVDASTHELGNAGSVNINARSTVEFDGTSSNSRSSGAFSFVGKSAVGNGGEVNITTGLLSVRNGAQLDASTRGRGNAGSVNIDARSTVEFDGVSNGRSSAALSFVRDTGVGKGGEVNITAGSLSVSDGAKLVTITEGQGNAGSVNIDARSTVEFDGVNSNGSLSGASSRVAKSAVGDGGDINIKAGALTVRKGARLSAGTHARGDAGDVNIVARESVLFDEVGSNQSRSGAFSNVPEQAVGDGGDINITTGSLIVRKGAQVDTSSYGTGAAGNIKVAARSIRLSNQGSLHSNTRGGQGNIFLRSQDLFLQSFGFIATNAIGTATGGNITIDTGIIVALENSDISANAEEGFGGRVIVDAQGIFGTKFRNQKTPLSDITATSRLGPKFSGTVEINTPDTDPSQGLGTLPTELVETSGLIASTCAAVGESKFTITGRGGLPPSPNEVLSSDAVWVDWGTLKPKVENSSSPPVSTNQTATEPAPIVEARGWVINNKGEVMLTANAPTTTPYSPWITSATCHTPQASS